MYDRKIYDFNQMTMTRKLFLHQHTVSRAKKLKTHK